MELKRGDQGMNGKLIAFVTVLFGASAAHASPPIAYAKVSGNANEVWLANPDGSGARRIYSASSKIGISFLDVRPGGGQLAIVENRNSIRLIDYDPSGLPTGSSQVPVASGCQIQGLDYHPANGSLLFSESCAGGSDKRIELFAGGQVQDVIAPLSVTPFEVRWLRDGSGFLWRAVSGGTGQQLRKSDAANPSADTLLWQMPFGQTLQSIDVGHTTDSFLLTWSGPPAYVYRYNFDFTGVTNEGVVASGQNGHYSPDDTSILYRVQTKSAYNLVISGPQGTRTVASGTIGVSDWQQ